MGNCTNCNDKILNPIPTVTPFCEQCSEENDKCIAKFRAECVIYNYDNDAPSRLVNLNIANRATLTSILETIDTMIGNYGKTPLVVLPTSTINISSAGEGAIRPNVIISSLPNNALSIKSDGLYVQGTSTTQPLKLPQLTTTEKNTVTPLQKGYIVFDSTINKISVYDGTSWKNLVYE